MLRQFLTHLKESTVELNYGRDIIAEWVKDYSRGKKHLKIVDIGIGAGADLNKIRSKIKQNADMDVYLSGLENYGPNIEKARQSGIDCKSCDIERDVFPYEDQSVDIIVAN